MQASNENKMPNIINYSDVSVSDVEVFSVASISQIDIDIATGKLTETASKRAMFYLHLEHSAGYFASILMQANNANLVNEKSFSFEVSEDPSKHFFSFSKSDISKCTALFEIGSVETNYLETEGQFVLKAKSNSDGGANLVAMLKHELNKGAYSPSAGSYEDGFFTGVSAMLVSGISRVTSRAAAQNGGRSSYDEDEPKEPQVEQGNAPAAIEFEHDQPEPDWNESESEGDDTFEHEQPEPDWSEYEEGDEEELDDEEGDEESDDEEEREDQEEDDEGEEVDQTEGVESREDSESNQNASTESAQSQEAQELDDEAKEAVGEEPNEEGSDKASNWLQEVNQTSKAQSGDVEQKTFEGAASREVVEAEGRGESFNIGL